MPVAVLAIANRLGANQALSDLVERVARVQSWGGWRMNVVSVEYSIDTDPLPGFVERAIMPTSSRHTTACMETGRMRGSDACL